MHKMTLFFIIMIYALTNKYTFKGVGANSEQLSAMNHDSLKRSTFQMTVKYNQNGELTMDGISLKRLRKASVHLPLFMMKLQLENKSLSSRI